MGFFETYLDLQEGDFGEVLVCVLLFDRSLDSHEKERSSEKEKLFFSVEFSSWVRFLPHLMVSSVVLSRELRIDSQ